MAKSTSSDTTIPEECIPFTISSSTPNEITIAAMLEADRIANDPKVNGYYDIDEMFANILK